MLIINFELSQRQNRTINAIYIGDTVNNIILYLLLLLF